VTPSGVGRACRRGERWIALANSEMGVEVWVGVRTVRLDEYAQHNELNKVGEDCDFRHQTCHAILPLQAR